MDILNKLLYYGITEKTDVLEQVRIKNRNIFNTVVIGLLFFSGSIGLLFGLKLLAIINLSASALLSLFSYIFPPYRTPKTGAYFGLLIPVMAGLLLYFFEPDISSSVLIFLMLFPIASTTLLPKKGIIISIALLLTVIVGNFFYVENNFLAMSNLNLILYVVGFSIMLLTAEIIKTSVLRRIHEQIERVDYYETEIRQRDEFISSLSHRLRTSLGNITLINNLVHDASMSSDQKQLLDTLRTSTLDLINDVNELVEIATPTIIDYKQSILSFRLSDALLGAVDILQSDKRSLMKLVINQIKDLHYNIIGDPSLIRSILINLVKGITEYGNTNDTINLSIERDYETQKMYGLKFILDFKLENKKLLDAAFYKSQKIGEGQTNHFTIAKRLLALSESKLKYEEKDGKFSMYFYQDFSIDLTQKPGKTTLEVKSLKEKGIKSLSDSNLLLVDDNTINQKIVILSLNKMVKSIDVANNGKEALDMFGTKKYDAILMDIQMPIMDGISATKKMREIEATSDERVPIIAITANALSGDRDNCLAAGADDYLSKPFQVDELIERISQLLG